MFLKNKNIVFKIRRSKVTDYAALSIQNICYYTVIKIDHELVLFSGSNVSQISFELASILINCRSNFQDFTVFSTSASSLRKQIRLDSICHRAS